MTYSVPSSICRLCNALRWCFFFFNDTATTEIYTLSLHDALPISPKSIFSTHSYVWGGVRVSVEKLATIAIDRKSTRLNSSHANISYAVFCLKKKNSSSKPARACRKSGSQVHKQLTQPTALVDERK